MKPAQNSIIDNERTEFEETISPVVNRILIILFLVEIIMIFVFKATLIYQVLIPLFFFLIITYRNYKYYMQLDFLEVDRTSENLKAIPLVIIAWLSLLCFWLSKYFNEILTYFFKPPEGIKYKVIYALTFLLFTFFLFWSNIIFPRKKQIKNHQRYAKENIFDRYSDVKEKLYELIGIKTLPDYNQIVNEEGKDRIKFFNIKLTEVIAIMNFDKFSQQQEDSDRVGTIIIVIAAIITLFAALIQLILQIKPN